MGVLNPAQFKTGVRLPSGLGFSTITPSIDFEGYSEAGYVLDTENRKVYSALGPHVPKNKTNSGIGLVGAAAYCEHPSTEPLSLAYDLYDGKGPRVWLPGTPPPQALFEYVATGGKLSAWNSLFEYLFWNWVMVRKYGWPELPLNQLTDAAAKSRAFSYPGALGRAGEATGVDVQKDKEGDRLLKKFSIPNNPTKKRLAFRTRPEDEPEDAGNLYRYNITDIMAEASIATICPDLSEYEQTLFEIDQEINIRGVKIDVESARACQNIVDLATDQYNDELSQLTGGVITKATQRERILGFLNAAGMDLPNLQGETVDDALEEYDDVGRVMRSGVPVPPHRAHTARIIQNRPDAVRVLEIRALLNSASVKKLLRLLHQTNSDQCLRDLFAYFGAHTGRWAGRGVQPQNIPSKGPEMKQCGACGRFTRAEASQCSGCHASMDTAKKYEWDFECAVQALEDFKLYQNDLQAVEYIYGNAIRAIVGSLRALVTARDGMQLVASDYTGIEGVVLACLAGEQWRIDAYTDKEDLYLITASDVFGVPLSELKAYKKRTGRKHPLRQKGKIGELASGYQGWVNAWKQFGAGKVMTDEEIEEAARKWREKSPMIVRFWHATEAAAINAVQNPGHTYEYRGIKWFMHGEDLYCRLLSGRHIVYHRAKVGYQERYGKTKPFLHYWGYKTVHGAKIWCNISTYGGSLTENIVQATARDILADAMIRVKRGLCWDIVLHIHDELVCELPLSVPGQIAVDILERTMMIKPSWCPEWWPVYAAGGWFGHRFRKD